MIEGGGLRAAGQGGKEGGARREEGGGGHDLFERRSFLRVFVVCS